MKVAPARYTRQGDVEFAEYGNGATAIRIMHESGEPECVATVNLQGYGVETPPDNRVWIKTWSENEGVFERLIEAGVITDTGIDFHCAHDAYAKLGALTPAALAERAEQRAKTWRPPVTLPARLIAIAVVALVVGGAGVHHRLHHHVHHDQRDRSGWRSTCEQVDCYGLPLVRSKYGPNVFADGGPTMADAWADQT